MKNIITLSILVSILGLSACENPTVANAMRIANRDAETSGSPFRWQAQSVNGGTIMRLVMIDIPNGPSRADDVLKKDILALITKAELADGRTAPQVEAIKPMKDGKEVWVLKSARDGIAYIVGFKPSPKGGTDIEMSGPKKFQKKDGG